MLLATLAVAIALAYIVSRRRVSVCSPVLAETDHYSLDWLTAHDLLALDGDGRPASPARGWHSVIVEKLTEAEDLLDALEVAGYEELELVVRGPLSFAVRWKE